MASLDVGTAVVAFGTSAGLQLALRRAGGTRPDRAGLSREQRTTVARAVRQGRAVDDPGLRAAAVAHARYHQRVARAFVNARTSRWLLVAAACFWLAGVVFGALRHQPVTDLLAAAMLGLTLSLPALLRRRLRITARALAANEPS